jgi:hypothetical protein
MAYSFIWLCKGAYSILGPIMANLFVDTPLNPFITGTHRQWQLCNSNLAKDDHHHLNHQSSSFLIINDQSLMHKVKKFSNG